MNTSQSPSNTHLSQLYAWLMPVLLVVAAYSFWAFVHPEALVYQEQLQMFLFDKEYLIERVVLPGGVARYVAEFIVQFYNKVTLGAALVAVLYLCVQQLVWLTSKTRCKSKTLGYILSLVPAIVLWGAMGDENVKLTFVVALIFALVAMSAYPEAKSKVHRLIYLAFAIPLLFVFAGPVVLMFTAYIFIVESLRPRGSNGRLRWHPLLYVVAVFFLAMIVVPCPSYRLFYGINYYLQIDKFPTVLYVVMTVTLLTVFLIRLVPQIKSRQLENGLIGGAFGAVFTSMLMLATLYFDRAKYDVFEYDYLVRGTKWEKIIAKAESTEAKSPLSAAAYNLALGQMGQMERATQFRQNGWSGVFPPFNKNYITSLMTSEVYWHLGLVNTAQRFMFEAMETIPDNNKSARIVRRLAETNLVNGQYAVARKYLLLLQKTIFYRRWATQTLALFGDEDAINGHYLYGHLRRCRLTDDFLFSEPEIDKVMGQLVMKNPDNHLAVAYLLLLPQLEGNQQKYMMYLDFVQKRRMQGLVPNDSTAKASSVNDSIK